MWMHEGVTAKHTSLAVQVKRDGWTFSPIVQACRQEVTLSPGWDEPSFPTWSLRVGKDHCTSSLQVGKAARFGKRLFLQAAGLPGTAAELSFCEDRH